MNRLARLRTSGLSALVGLGMAATAQGGMPSGLPEDVATVLRLNAEPRERIEVISFFAVGLLLVAEGVRVLWNVLAKDFELLPRLTYFRSLSLVVLCGLMFMVVLTMISGARELMTPGAWRKTGITYSLNSSTTDTVHGSSGSTSRSGDTP